MFDTPHMTLNSWNTDNMALSTTQAVNQNTFPELIGKSVAF